MARVPCPCSCMNVLAWSVTLDERIEALREAWDEGRGLLFMDADDVESALAHLAGVWIAVDKLANGYPDLWKVWGNQLSRITESIGYLAAGIRAGTIASTEVTDAIRAMKNRSDDVYRTLTTECER